MHPPASACHVPITCMPTRTLPGPTPAQRSCGHACHTCPPGCYANFTPEAAGLVGTGGQPQQVASHSTVRPRKGPSLCPSVLRRCRTVGCHILDTAQHVTANSGCATRRRMKAAAWRTRCCRYAADPWRRFDDIPKQSEQHHPNKRPGVRTQARRGSAAGCRAWKSETAYHGLRPRTKQPPHERRSVRGAQLFHAQSCRVVGCDHVRLIASCDSDCEVTGK